MPRILRPLMGVALVLALATAPARAQIAVVSVKSYDDVMADVKYVMTMAGQEERFTQLEGIIDALTGGKGFTGLDTKRPIGAYVHAPKQAGAEPDAIVFVPITKEVDFLDLLKSFNIEPGEPEKGVYPLTASNGEVFYLRFAHQCAFGGKTSESLQGNLPEPAKIIPPSAKNYLVAASFRVELLPKELKQKFLEEMSKGIDAEKEKKPEETEAQHQGRLAGMKMAKEAITTLVDETKDVTLGLAVDQKKHKLALDLALTPKAGSKLAASVKSFGESRSVFSAFTQDSALSFLVHIPLAEDLQKEFGKLFEEGFKEGLKQIDDPKQRELAEKMLKTLQESVQGDAIDFGGALKGPYGDKYAVIAGLKVKDGKKLEGLVKDLVKEIPANEGVKVKLNAEKIGSDSVHVIEGDQIDEKAEKVLGKSQIYVVFRPGMVVLAVGEKGMTALKDALAALDKGGVKAGSPIQLEFSVARLARIGSEDQEHIQELIKKIFQGENKDRDKVRISVEGGESLKLRLDMDAQILKLVGELINPLLGQ